ncbi:hypothetical protein IWX81_002152 [Salinibacterium sp. CAN_S4]|uniref:hypothetical protein n=1 Tax=Salinibacterium sp. CAN_S4 TaxID=2787727 RepID=UPI0018EFC8E6
MSDTDKEFDDTGIIEAQGPDVEVSSDAPAPSTGLDPAQAYLEDQVRSVRSAEEGQREEPGTE